MDDDLRLRPDDPTPLGGVPTDDVAAGEASAPPRSLKKPVIWGIVALAALLIAVIALLPRALVPPGSTEDASAGTTDSRRIQATLYYLSDIGTELVAVVREVPYGASPSEQARLILQAQLQTPEGQASAIPPGTKLRGLFLGGKGEAYVDLSPEAQTAATGGTLDEALAVYAIVNALTTNLPDVTAVQILVDGQEVDTLAGHVDLREPLGRSSAWIRKGP
jgi:flagellar basal body-associated protein FliL